MAYTKVGDRNIQERAYISFDNYKQGYIDATYQRLKDDVRRRALNEMRVQQCYVGQFTRMSIPLVRRVYPQLIVPNMPLDYLKHRKTDCHKVDWKKEGF
jgi:hypothetical protein